MSATDFRKPVAPDAVVTPPTGYFGKFISDGSQAFLSPGDPTTVANTEYLIGDDRTLYVGSQAIQFYAQEFTGFGSSPMPLELVLDHPFSGALAIVFFDGIEQPAANFELTQGSTDFTIPDTVDVSDILSIRIKFTRL